MMKPDRGASAKSSLAECGWQTARAKGAVAEVQEFVATDAALGFCKICKALSPRVERYHWKSESGGNPAIGTAQLP